MGFLEKLNATLKNINEMEDDMANNQKKSKVNDENLKNLGLDDDEIKKIKNEGYEETDFEEESDSKNYNDDDYYGDDDK